MPTIKTIHIKNFRSIINQTIEVEDFNVFVGMNDSGKSNVLKALNLFFNGQTDGDTPFDFKVDFSKHAASLVHKAKEIRITLTIVPPPTYSDKEVEWTKCWRAEGEHSLKDEGIKITIPKEPTKGTYTRMFLNRIRYKYVPAIKSDDFSARLLGELYLCVSAEENSDFRKRMDDYANALQQYTQSISTEIKAKIGMDSKIIRSTRPTADFFHR